MNFHINVSRNAESVRKGVKVKDKCDEKRDYDFKAKPAVFKCLRIVLFQKMIFLLFRVYKIINLDN